VLFRPNLLSDPDQSRRGRAARLAEALLADRAARETTKPQSVTCGACGRGMVNHNRRCCSPRCEQWLADGNSPVDPHLARKALEVARVAGIREALDVEFGVLALRGADGLLLPDQEWNRRVSADEVVHCAAKTKVLPTTPPKMATRCLAKDCRRKAAGESRFCSKACRTAFDSEGEESRARAQAMAAAAPAPVDLGPVEPAAGESAPGAPPGSSSTPRARPPSSRPFRTI
jgi:hypothetical protein